MLQIMRFLRIFLPEKKTVAYFFVTNIKSENAMSPRAPVLSARVLCQGGSLGAAQGGVHTRWHLLRWRTYQPDAQSTDTPTP